MSEEIVKVKKPRKTKSEYNKTYYEKKKETLINNGCRKVECPECHKVVTKNNLRYHVKSNLCLKRQFLNTNI
jgi:hypothetical protein